MQPAEQWIAELRAAGWLPWSPRLQREAVGSSVWRAPSGNLFRGPYGAWRAMCAGAV